MTLDEHPKPKTTIEQLAKLPTVFKKVTQFTTVSYCNLFMFYRYVLGSMTEIFVLFVCRMVWWQLARPAVSVMGLQPSLLPGTSSVLPPRLILASTNLHISSKYPTSVMPFLSQCDTQCCGSGSRSWKNLLRIRIQTELWYGSGSRQKRYGSGKKVFSTRKFLERLKNAYFPCFVFIMLNYHYLINT